MKDYIKGIVILIVLSVLYQKVTAQEIEVDCWEENPNISHVPSEIYISSKRLKHCAVLILSTNKSIDIEADYDIVKRQIEPIYNEWNRVDYVTVLYLLPETTSLTISRKELIPFCYNIPVELEAGKVYSAKINVEKKNSSTERTYKTIASSDLLLSDFRENPKSLIASTNPRYDNAGKACAVIRYYVNDPNFVIEPNLGVVDSEIKPGLIIQYVPEDTRRLTIRNDNYMPISGYEIPITIRSKMTYDVNLALSDSSIKRKKASPDHDNYLGVGYNDTMYFPENGGTHTFTIHCNSTWSISTPSWCRVSESSGHGIMEITVTVKGNKNSPKRIGAILVTSEGMKSTIDIEQQGHINIEH